MIITPRTIVRLIIICISLGLSLSAGRTIVELWRRRDIIHVREQELTRLQKDNAEMEVRLKDMKSEAYVEKVARDQLGMIKEGETIVMLPESASSSGMNDLSVQEANWRQWWSLFF